MPLHVVACDELAHYTTADSKLSKEFSALMRDLVSRGRAAGIVVIAATQKPSHDVVPTALRDLFGFRLALRCSTREASDTILGSGWASQGFSAAAIDASDRGVGYLLHEGGEPVRIRACYLSDDDLKALAARAEALRAGNHGASAGLASVVLITNGEAS
jgi:S-DNA-T family DNA segregation ATPase FtsK/SpoIIIE